MTKKEEREFKRKIEDTKSLAKQLGYDRSIIAKFKDARNEIHLENMLIAARHAAM